MEPFHLILFVYLKRISALINAKRYFPVFFQKKLFLGVLDLFWDDSCYDLRQSSDFTLFFHLDTLLFQHYYEGNMFSLACFSVSVKD